MSKSYTIPQRKKLADKINKITYYPCIRDIGKIISHDTAVKNNNNYTINKYGFHILVSKLSNGTFKQLDKYIMTILPQKMSMQKKNTFKNSILDTEGSVKTTVHDVKLSSREKKFIKKIQNDS